MKRPTALVIIMIALIIVLASGLVVLTLPKTPTITFTKQTVVVVGIGVVCGTTEEISEFTYTTTAVTTISPTTLPQDYGVTIVTASTLSTYTYPAGYHTTC